MVMRMAWELRRQQRARQGLGAVALAFLRPPVAAAPEQEAEAQPVAVQTQPVVVEAQPGAVQEAPDAMTAVLRQRRAPAVFVPPELRMTEEEVCDRRAAGGIDPERFRILGAGRSKVGSELWALAVSLRH